LRGPGVTQPTFDFQNQLVSGFLRGKEGLHPGRDSCPFQKGEESSLPFRLRTLHNLGSFVECDCGKRKDFLPLLAVERLFREFRGNSWDTILNRGNSGDTILNRREFRANSGDTILIRNSEGLCSEERWGTPKAMTHNGAYLVLCPRNSRLRGRWLDGELAP
jgi:hypothetical protein